MKILYKNKADTLVSALFFVGGQITDRKLGDLRFGGIICRFGNNRIAGAARVSSIVRIDVTISSTRCHERTEHQRKHQNH